MNSVNCDRRILLIHHFTQLGGATKSLFLIAKALLSKGYKPEVLFLSEMGPATKMFQNLNIKCHHLSGVTVYPHAHGAKLKFVGSKPFKPIADLVRSYRSISIMNGFFEENKYDLVHLNTSLLLPCAIAAKRNGVRVIWHLRENLYQGLLGLRLSLIRWVMLNYSDRIVAISKANAKKLGISKKITVVYNYSDSDSSTSKDFINSVLTKTKDREIVVFLGGTVHSKGLKVFLKASKLIDSNAHPVAFVVAGSNPTRPFKFNSIYYKLKHLIVSKSPNDFAFELQQQNRLPDHFYFIGFTDNINELLKSSSILVWPATEPHFARPIIEAYLNDTPVIATDFETTRELVENGVSGLLFPKNDHRKLAFSIVKLLEDKKLRNEFSYNGLRKAKESFQLKNNSEKIMAIYHELLT